MSWIISRRQDLIWFHLAVIPSLLLGALFALGPANPLTILCAWGVLFDGTHVWATYARSYLADEPDLPSRRWLAIVLIGPAIALALPRAFPSFLLAAYLWAYWHLVRQHWGFVALYLRAGLRGQTTRLGTLLWIGCAWPFVRFGLSADYAASGLPQLIPALALPSLRWAVDLLTAGALGALGIFRALDRRPLHLGPAHLYVAIAIALHLFAFALLHSLLPIMATLTLFHNLEYHRIVQHYQERRGRSGHYLVAGLVFGALWYVPRIFGVALSPQPWSNALAGLGWGVAFHHYLVDGRIWRLRKPALREALA
jgi:hypothetical protein